MTSVRKQMVEFWSQQSKKKNGGIIHDETSEDEVQEVLSLLPDLRGKTVLELGCGTGRFTRHLCERASSVIAVDFMQGLIEQNKQRTRGCGNVLYNCWDVTDLVQPTHSVDVIFSNWLHQYLDDEECHELIRKCVTWLKPEGVLFFRESCFHQSDKVQGREFNPTFYRVPGAYMSMVESARERDETDAVHGFELVLSRSIQAYSKNYKNNNQICWLLSKVSLDSSSYQGFQTFQQFLDAKQYSRNGILRYEKIFGRHFVSTGGRETTEDFVAMLDLKPGQAVLDIGAGIGGSAFYMAEHFDVTVLAIDLSSNMINIGLERANEIGDNRVQFEIADATKRKYTPQSYDVIYSRDTILHIKDKHALFAAFYDWLKPGGKVLISDYCCGEGQHSQVYTDYVKQRGYHVVTVRQYGQILESVGFENVRAEDKNDLFVEVLERELARTKAISEDFIQEFSPEDYDAIVNGWTEKLERVAQGDQRWGLFYAEKPSH